MRRILLLTVFLTAALPGAAHAAVTSSVTSGTLVVTGDNADDHIELTGTPTTVSVDGVPFDRASFSSIIVRAGGGADEIVTGPGVSALIDGQSGTDTALVLGTDESEEFTLQSFVARARVTRDTDPGVIEMAATEVLSVSTGRGPDFVDVGDLSGTGVTRVDADLGLLDGPNDSLNVQGTDGADGIGASLLGERLRLTGLPVEVRVANGDRVTAFGFGGNDKLTALAPFPGLTFDGGEGSDDLTGPAILRGGGGDDLLKRGLSMSGDAGTDRLSFSGTSADDTIEVARSSVAGVPVDGVESIDVTPGAGKDTVHVGDLSGSPVTAVRADLGGLDSRLDTLAIDGSPAADDLTVRAVGTNHEVSGLGYTVAMVTTDPGQVLEINGGAGEDTIDASAMTKDKTQPFLFGGAGKDFLIGSPGQDVIDGGTEVDVALLAGGLDTFVWRAGDGGDIVEGGAGTDFMRIDGTSEADSLNVSPIGGRARASLNLETIDTGDLERFDVFLGRGADNARVDDMSGTDVTHVEFTGAIARNSTVKDGAADSLRVNGTNGFDAITVQAAGPEVRETGLAATVVTRFNDPGLDRLHIDTRLGNDLVSVGALVGQQVIFTQS